MKQPPSPRGASREAVLWTVPWGRGGGTVGQFDGLSQKLFNCFLGDEIALIVDLQISKGMEIKDFVKIVILRYDQ